MEIEKQLKAILEEIMDVDPATIKSETFMIRELETESIDLLEIAVEISNQFNINVDDDIIFLTKLRAHLNGCEADKKEETVLKEYPHISSERAKEMLSQLDNGPVLKFKDLLSYITNKQGV